MQDFATALLDPAQPLPAGIAAAAPVQRFAVHRNTVVAGLSRALAMGFPAVEKITGAAFFAAMAADFVRRHPPSSPVLLRYGDGFGDFIAGFGPAVELPYLADVARLEAAYTRAWHAADTVPLPQDALASVAPETLGGLRIALHPAVAVLRSTHPVAAIWAMNTGGLPLAPIDNWTAEDALVLRHGLDVEIQRLAPGQAAFLLSLADGAPLATAAEAAFAETPAFDLPAALAALFRDGLAVTLHAHEDIP